MRQGGSVCQIATIFEMKQIKQATIVVPCRCLENKSCRHLVSVPEVVPTRISRALFASNLLAFW